MEKIVLGVKIDDISMDEAVRTVSSWLSKPGKHSIVTPNPEILVAAKEDNQLQIVLNKSNLAVPDGIGLKMAGIKNRISGTDLMIELVKLAAEKGYFIGLLGGRDKVAERAADVLKKKFPKLKISFASSGGDIDESGINKYSSNVVRSKFSLRSNDNVPNTDILFVAFGPPKQEKWIARNLKKIPVKIAMGVGGAFDFISGEIPRAPKWIRALGLEWLFRLIVEPWRIRRQLALIKYLIMLW